MFLEGVLVPAVVMVGGNMEIRNLGSDLFSIMMITILITNDPHLGKSDTGQGARGTSSLWIGFE